MVQVWGISKCLLWVRNGHFVESDRCLRYLRKLTSFSKLGSFCKYVRGGRLVLAAVALPFGFCGQSNLDQAANCLRAGQLGILLSNPYVKIGKEWLLYSNQYRCAFARRRWAAFFS
jgi:hypothetical protein